MKRIISVLLVAVMLVSCMATVAFAAESATVSADSKTVEAGKEYTVNVAISTSVIDTYEIDVAVDEGLEVTAIDVVKYDNTMTDYTDTLDHVTLIAFDSFEASKLFTLTVKVAEDAKPGDYKVNLSGYASNADEDLNISFVAGVLTIEAPETECPHTETEDGKVTKEPDCVNVGSQEIVCKACGAVVGTKELPALGHEWSTEWTADGEDHWHECVRCDAVADKAAHDGEDWLKDKNNHWHECSVCEAEHDKAAHTWKWHTINATTEKEGSTWEECTVCGQTRNVQTLPVIPGPDDPVVPPTGDITGIVTTGISALVIVLFSAVAIITKRKAI